MTPDSNAPPLDAPPPRLPWEEPPADGWSSSATDVGLGFLSFVISVAVGLAALRAYHEARLLGRHHQHGLEEALRVGMWWLAALLAIGLAIYVWRRLGGLALILAMLTDHGRTGRMKGRPPIWLDHPPTDALRIAHLSDLHLGESSSVRLVERAIPAGNRYLPGVLDSPAIADADLIVFTGDITDRGTAGAWHAFFAELDARNLASKTILVPGNHDVALVEHIEPMKLRGDRRWATKVLRIDRFGIVMLANLMKFAEAFARTAGGQRGRLLWSTTWGSPPADSDGKPVSYATAWAAVEPLVRPLIEALPSTPVPPLGWRRWFSQLGPRRAYVRRIELARRRLLALFPVAVEVPERDTVLFLLNSSTRVSRHPATCALGYLGYWQLRRLQRLATHFAARVRLVALHHHVVRRGEELAEDFVNRVFAKFSVLADSWRVTRFCKEHDVRAVLNGHRHLGYQLRLPNGTVLLAAASSTLGDELSADPRPQLERYDIARVQQGPSVGIHRVVVREALTAPVEVLAIDPPQALPPGAAIG